jgi:uncharacterized protein (DUF1697 family)
MLRGINVGAARRIAMAQLRALLGDAGFSNVVTHGQSGNVALDSELDGEALAARVGGLIAQRFAFPVPVTVRSADELVAVIALDPIEGAAADPKRYQVTFLAGAPSPEAVARLDALVAQRERFAVHGRELYSHHPDGIARSKLAARLTHAELGAGATARNWATVAALRDLSSGCR